MRAIRTMPERPVKVLRAPEEKPQKPTRKKRGVKAGFIVLVLACVFLASFAALYFLNGWQLVLDLPDGVTETLECPVTYERPVVSAFLRGKWLFRKGFSVPVRESGAVDGAVPGRYSIGWEASLFELHAEVRREVLVVDTTPSFSTAATPAVTSPSTASRAA